MIYNIMNALYNLMEGCRSVFNIRFKKENVHISNRDYNERILDMPWGLYRFWLYEISKRKDLMEQLNNLQ